jgi:iron complex outermembrane receptor protein
MKAVAAAIPAACAQLLLIFPARAQDVAVDATEPIETITVTGSRLSVQTLTANPALQIVTREEAQNQGITTSAQLMARVPANSPGANDAMAEGGQSAPGYAGANLRSVGSGSTLVLLNGHRIANYAFDGDGPDLNSIPLVGLERVEILKEAASAVYGSGAVAGVVNFILREDFHGFSVTGRDDRTQHGGADSQDLNLVVGKGTLQSDRYNLFAAIDYRQTSALTASQRSFSRTGYLPAHGVISLSGVTFPANIDAGAHVFLNPTYASGCAPPFSIPANLPVLSSTPTCGYDYARAADILPPTARYSALSRATWQISATTSLFVDALYAHDHAEYASSPASVFQGGTVGSIPVLYPADGPYYPTAFAAANGLTGPLNVRYRSEPLGPQRDGVASDALYLTAGITGITSGWKDQATLSYSDNSETDSYLSGYVSQQRILAALASGQVNPFGESNATGDRLLHDAQITGPMHHGSGTTIAVEGNVSRILKQLAGGSLAFTTGGEVRRERLSHSVANVLASGDVLGNGVDAQYLSGSRSVWAIFTELTAPLTPRLSMQLAGRYDHYSDFGSTFNPKLSLSAQVVGSLLLRGSWGTAFRAPGLYELYAPRTTSFLDSGFVDPVRCPVTQLPQDCGGPLSAVSGGNPQLQPELSHQYTLGLVFRPFPAIDLGVEYWHLHTDQVIGTLSPDVIFGQFPVYAPTNIVRGPPTPALPGLPGPIETVLLTNQNLGNQQTSGLDIAMHWRGPTTSAGQMQLSLDGTYVLNLEYQPDGLTYVSALGSFWPIGPTPRWRQTMSLDWSRREWGATLSGSYQSGYLDSNTDRLGNPLDVPPHSVDSYTLLDLNGRYNAHNGLTMAVGAMNILDRKPPFTNQAQYRQIGWDPNYADPHLRSFYVQLTYTAP